MSFTVFLQAPRINALVGCTVVLGQWPTQFFCWPCRCILWITSLRSNMYKFFCTFCYGELFFFSWLYEKIDSTLGSRCPSLALSDCRLWLACPCSRPFFSSDLLRSAAFCGACLGPEDTWVCIFFSLPFSLVNGRPVVSWSQSSQLHGHKIPWWLVMTLFVPAKFLLGNNFCLEGVTVGMSWHSFGSQIAESGAVEPLGPFIEVFCCGSGRVVPWGKPVQSSSDARMPAHRGQGGQGTWCLLCPLLGQSWWCPFPCARSEPQSSPALCFSQSCCSSADGCGDGLGGQKGCAALHHVTPRRCGKSLGRFSWRGWTKSWVTWSSTGGR